ncbi:MAG: CooT family nickel-binding protein [Desulfobacteraceae bacterium]|jgi:predicted RNA-binding protein
MCESSVFVLKNGIEERIMESVDLLENEGDEIRLVDIFGEEKRIKARIKRFALVNHRIVLEPLE